MKRLLLVLTISLTCLVSVPDGVSAVTYGDPVESPQVDFPEVVPIWVGGKTLCTGTLIQQQVVLTAAHCIYGEPGPFQISVGAKTLNSGSLIDVDATWYHPRYDARFNQNDIGLLHLKSAAGVQRLGALPSGKLTSLGKKFLIVGWGRDQNGSVTGRLHRLTLNDQGVAARKDFKGFFNPKTMIGAGRYFAAEVLYGGGCTGDSGGPLYQGASGASKTIVGLTSFGARGCTVYKPTVFTRLDFYVAEVNKGIQLLNARATSSPTPTGKATPAGAGPTTTTSTLPLKPLQVVCENYSYSAESWSTRGGFSVMCKSNLNTKFDIFGDAEPNSVVTTKVCVSINGQRQADYDKKTDRGLLFTIYGSLYGSDAQGCYKWPKNSVEILSIGNPFGTHTAAVTFIDSVGRAATYTFSFNSTRNY
jgi:trypsin